MDLFDLVNSFIEKGYGGETGRFDYDHNSDNDEDPDVEEMKDSLKMLFAFENCDEARRKITVAVQKSWRRVIKDGSSPSSPGFKRQLMAGLRDQGFDAGLCKSTWEKKGRLPSGYHDYVDININGTRYITNVFLAGEFEIARPSENYVSLLDVFPQISVCKVEELKKIVRIMCDAMKKSMNQQQMSVPPWRRYEYNHTKWFGSYKRITDEFPTNIVADSRVSSTGVVGVLSFSGQSCYRSRRREDFGGRGILFENW